jgi:uncharacterized protein
MAYGDLSSGLVFDMRRDSPFSYVCGACNRCCEGKAIRVGPYEVLRLSRFFGLSTTEFIARHTTSGGTILKLDSSGTCGFLTEKGCSVHPDRPLACRLYPLGMEVAEGGEEHFACLVPHPDTRGLYGNDGTVGDYLERQAVAPFIEANQKYEEIYAHMVRVLALIDPEESGKRQERREAADEMGEGTLISDWMDIDSVLTGETPTSPEAAVDRHVAMLEAKVSALAEEPVIGR